MRFTGRDSVSLKSVIGRIYTQPTTINITAQYPEEVDLTYVLINPV